MSPLHGSTRRLSLQQALRPQRSQPNPVSAPGQPAVCSAATVWQPQLNLGAASPDVKREHRISSAGTPELNGLGLGAADRPGLGAGPAAADEVDGEAPGGLGLGATPGLGAGLGATPGLGATAGLGAADGPHTGLGGFTPAGLGSDMPGGETPGGSLPRPPC
jgi:hypothetical protein